MKIVMILLLPMGLNAMQIIGHRGACGYAPENTHASFERAIELGVGMVEFDVQRCKSGELVVIHDLMVDRTTNGSGYVSELTLDEIQKLDAGDGEQIPTLREVLDRVDQRVAVNIEIKAAGIVGGVAAIIDEYVRERKWRYDHFLVSSFLHHEIVQFKKQCPQVPTSALLVGELIDYMAFADELGVDAVGCSADFISHEMVRDAHARGKKIFVFTVNNTREAHRVADLGVDGIFSNYPDRMSNEITA